MTRYYTQHPEGQPAPQAELVCILSAVAATIVLGAVVIFTTLTFFNQEVSYETTRSITSEAISDPRLYPLYKEISADKKITLGEWSRFQKLSFRCQQLDEQANTRKLLTNY
jgi:hypothetical protein